MFHLDSKPRLLVISLGAQHRPVFLPASCLVLAGRAFLCFFLRSREIELGWGCGGPCNFWIIPSRQVMNRPEVASQFEVLLSNISANIRRELEGESIVEVWFDFVVDDTYSDDMQIL